ncbi:MAG: hydrogenase [Verrucomicrobia bacterium]|nr:hydrogenase [Verrucomicrobiota bacterium]
MALFVVGCGVCVVGGIGAFFLSRSRCASWLATAGIWIGCGLVLVPVLAALQGRGPEPFKIAWSLPGGSISLGLDELSAFFCLPVLLIAPCMALYACLYLAHETKPLGSLWFFTTVLVTAMLLLTAARDGLLFLMIWELMALSSLLLVLFDDEHPHVRQAGWTYLIATHMGTAVLLVFFAWLGAEAGSLEFSTIAAAKVPARAAGGLFALAVIGFGSKAGFVPLHVWLPEAHPAAPSHVSALMSGVMIKTGIYGLLRALMLLGEPSVAWGWSLVAIGLISGVLGVVFALAQHDIKRLLAYHSVENIGIITLGIGVGILGRCWNQPALIVLGFGGGILHVLNHAVFKSLLFLGAGAVAHSTGTRDIDHLGGLLKSMRWTGATFLVASAAISGLPPFNGFVSEFLIYIAGLRSAQAGGPYAVLLAIAILAGLALIGGLAAACFAKAFGIVFLGEPRSSHAAHAREVGPAMRWPMVVLAVLCLGIGLLAPLVVKMVLPVVSSISGVAHEALSDSVAGAMQSLTSIGWSFAVLLVLIAGFYLVRRVLPRAKQQAKAGTWDCGYARPTPRMQYTSSSFAQPLVDLLKMLLGTRNEGKPVHGLFPREASFSSDTPDAARERLFVPLFRLLDRVLAPIRRLQRGGIHEYLLYVMLTLLALLIWKGGRP